jgi:hypothetical protein
MLLEQKMVKILICQKRKLKILILLANINKLGHEDHIPGQVRDWNEELQITKELPKKNLPERLIRERAMFKVNRKTNDFENILFAYFLGS